MSFCKKTTLPWLTIFKIVIMVGAYGYLTYLLITFDKYKELAESFTNITTHQSLLLIVVIALMPINWLLESYKWKTLVSQVQKTTIKDSVKSVLMGLASGFFTPNRVCDPVGRVLLLKEGNRAKGVLFSVVSTMAQSFAGALLLLVAIIAIPWADFTIGVSYKGLRVASMLFIAIITTLYITLPLWSGKIEIRKYPEVDKFFRAVDAVTYRVLLRVSLQSLLRYILYCTQYYLMLQFMGVELTIFEAIVLIPVNYFLISVTPSVSFSEIGIRGTYASLLIGTITANPVGAAMAAVTVWVINYIIPLITGSMFIVKYK